jgi:asparagine synthase (glutamine-hydrolysing)
MSVQFGRWNIDGQPIRSADLARVQSTLAAYGPDANGFYNQAGVGIFYCAFHTTKESRQESQPYVTSSGSVITWDGRLDNRTDLIRDLRGRLTPGSTDIEIVAVLYEQSGTNCFGKLIGDWACSLWNPNDRSVILAKDFAGKRHLHYLFDREQITWCTILDPLLLFSDKTFRLCEEYLAGWLSTLPAAHLTPFMGVHSVPPASFVTLRPGKHTVQQYWEFDPTRRIKYATDAGYEEHFRTAFEESVRRCLRSDTPVLAELSGGMDSSSIVCMSDRIISGGSAETPRLDTLSYYDDSEPHWDERPYFAKVEEDRGRVGCRIDLGSARIDNLSPSNDSFAATPSSLGRANESLRRTASCMAVQGNRVVLSGIGGDEVTGGVPTPLPELADLLVSFHFKSLGARLKLWALAKRQPWFHILFEAIRGFLPFPLLRRPKQRQPPPWIEPAFAERHRAALSGYEQRLHVFGPLPSFQDNMSTLETLKRQLACSPPHIENMHETRFPYLDRTLLEFLYSIPREQLVRPGHRRSLMRRALVGIVPGEILNRRRKAYAVRKPMAAVLQQCESLLRGTPPMAIVSAGIADHKKLAEAALRIRQGEGTFVISMIRTLTIERWLRHLESHASGSFSVATPEITKLVPVLDELRR